MTCQILNDKLKRVWKKAFIWSAIMTYLQELRKIKRLTSCTEYTAELGATISPISFILSAKSFLSSVSMMDWIGVPRILTLYFSNTPARCSCTPQFSAVCPPNVSSTPSGLSDIITFKTQCNITHYFHVKCCDLVTWNWACGNFACDPCQPSPLMYHSFINMQHFAISSESVQMHYTAVRFMTSLLFFINIIWRLKCPEGYHRSFLSMPWKKGKGCSPRTVTSPSWSNSLQHKHPKHKSTPLTSIHLHISHQ